MACLYHAGTDAIQDAERLGRPPRWHLATGGKVFGMSEKQGEIARESSGYRCEQCHQVTAIARGALIPACPHCGFGTFDIANPRLERRDGTLGPHEPG